MAQPALTHSCGSRFEGSNADLVVDRHQQANLRNRTESRQHRQVVDPRETQASYSWMASLKRKCRWQRTRTSHSVRPVS
jgi:hypothetical protein